MNVRGSGDSGLELVMMALSTTRSQYVAAVVDAAGNSGGLSFGLLPL